MSPLFGVSLLLFAGLLGHVAATDLRQFTRETEVAVTDLRILSVAREVSVDQQRFLFSIHYQSSQRPVPRWSVWTKDGSAIFNGAVSHLGYQGTASLEFARGRLLHVSTEFGDSDLLHYFALVWKIDSRPLRLQSALNLPAVFITPGPNLTYAEGENTTVEVTWTEEERTGVTSNHGRILALTGTYLDPFTHEMQISKSPDSMEFLEVNVTSTTSGMTKNTFDFMTGGFPINGYFSASLKYSVVDQSTSPVESKIEERFKLLVHEDNNRGPFPNDRAYVGFLTKDPNCTVSGCGIVCRLYANDVDRYNVQIYKMGPNKTVTLMTDYADANPSLHMLSTGLFVHGQGGAGRYSCRATNKETTKTEALAITAVTMV